MNRGLGKAVRGLMSWRAVLLIGTALPAAAFAAEGTGLEEIVVTAQKRAENLQVTPVAVTALTPTTLREAGVHDTVELARHTPSLSITPSGGGSLISPQVSLRGQLQNAINITNDPSVALYVDDVYIGKDSGSVTDLVDMERVEVLKGPQGTLFGRNSTGGAIRYISAAPKLDKFSGFVRASYGNYNSALVESAVNVPITTNSAGRVAVSYRRHDGYVHDYLGVPGPTPGTATILRERDVNSLDSLLVRGRYLLEASDDFTINLIATYHNRKSDGRANHSEAGDNNPNNSVSAASDPNMQIRGFYDSPQHRADFYSTVTSAFDALGNPVNTGLQSVGYLLSGTAEWTPSPAFGVKLVLGYMNNRLYDYMFDVDGSVVAGITASNVQKFRQESAELQFAGKIMDGRLDYVAGAYYFHESGHDISPANFFVGVPVSQGTIGLGRNTSTSGFAHVIYSIDDATKISAGARYTRDDKALDVTGYSQVIGISPIACPYIAGTANVINTGASPPNINNCSSKPRATFPFWSYSAGIDHEFMEGVFAYFRTGSTARSGGHQIRSTDGNLAPFKPERLTDYEWGVKLDLFDRHLRVNADYYRGNYKDIQFTRIVSTTSGSGAPTTIVQNVGSAVVQGFEIESVVALPAGFGLEGNISLTDVGYDNPAQHQFRVPRWLGSAALTYNHDLSFGTFHGRIDYYQRGDTPEEERIAVQAANPLVTAPGYSIWGARVGVEFQNRLDLSIYCQNCTGKHYYVDGFSLPPIFAGYYGDPRTFGIEANWKF